MKKSIKSSATSSKSGVKSVVNSAVSAAVSGSGSSHDVAVAVASGAAAPAAVEGLRSSAVVAVMDSDIKLIELRQKISSHFAAPEWSGAAAVRAALAAAGVEMSDEMINAAVSAAARKSGVDLSPRYCSVSRVLAVIRRYYLREFENLCGCPFGWVRDYYKTNVGGVFAWRLSSTLIQPNSDVNDFISVSSLGVDSSVSAVVSAVLSIRHLYAFNVGLAAACNTARADFFDSLSTAFRSGRKLGISVADMCRYLQECESTINDTDKKEMERLTKNLERTNKQLRGVDASIILSCVAATDVDTSGDFVVCSSLPAVGVPAVTRRLWAKRVRLLSAVDTLRRLIEMA